MNTVEFFIPTLSNDEEDGETSLSILEDADDSAPFPFEDDQEQGESPAPIKGTTATSSPENDKIFIDQVLGHKILSKETLETMAFDMWAAENRIARAYIKLPLARCLILALYKDILKASDVRKRLILREDPENKNKEKEVRQNVEKLLSSGERLNDRTLPHAEREETEKTVGDLMKAHMFRMILWQNVHNAVDTMDTAEQARAAQMEPEALASLLEETRKDRALIKTLRERMLLSYQRYLFSLAKKILPEHYRQNKWDAIQDASIYVFKAIDKWHPKNGTFANYMDHWARQAIKNRERLDDNLIITPCRGKDLAKLVRLYGRCCQETFSHHINEGDFFEWLKKEGESVTKETWADFAYRGRVTNSLDDTSPDHPTFQHAGPQTQDPSNIHAENIEKTHVHAALKSLRTIEKAVLILNNGIVDPEWNPKGKTYNLSEIALGNNLVRRVFKSERSRERVRQIKEQALFKFRANILRNCSPQERATLLQRTVTP